MIETLQTTNHPRNKNIMIETLQTTNHPGNIRTKLKTKKPFLWLPQRVPVKLMKSQENGGL